MTGIITPCRIVFLFRTCTIRVGIFILPKTNTMKKSTLVFLAIFLVLLYASIAVAQNFGVMYAIPIGTVFLLWSIFGVYLFDLHETNAKK